MTFLPIMERELRVRARSRAAYWTRFGVALVAVLICLPALWISSPFASPATVGRYVFNGLLGIGFVLSCAACLVTAGAINSERREGTLGLLFLTRVRSLDVLLGKLGSAGLTCLCAVLAFLPVLIIPILAGGVTGGEAFRKALILPNTLLFALAVGLYGSASRQGRKAIWISAGVMLGLVLLPPFFLWMARGLGPSMLRWLSPLSALSLAGDISYRTHRGEYWLSLVVLDVLTGLLLLIANLQLRRGMMREDPEGKTCQTSSSLLLRKISAPVGSGYAGLSRAHPTFGARLKDGRWQIKSYGIRPIEWLVLRQRGVLPVIWGAAFVGLISSMFMMFFPRMFGVGAFRAAWYYLIQLPGLGFSLLGGALFAWASSHFFVEARRTGELELLATTPLGAPTLVSGQWSALKRLMAGPLVMLLAPMFLRTVMMFFVDRGLAGAWQLQFVFSLILSVANTILMMGAICWLGLWFGWSAKNQAAAIAWTVALAKGLPFLISMFGIALISPLLFGLFRGLGTPIYYFVSLLPQVAIVYLNVQLIRFAQRRLSRAFPAAPPPSFRLRGPLEEAVEGVRKARHWTPG
jgi:ABC-type transport system involved in multi-copper enzyme maturation permease subunit